MRLTQTELSDEACDRIADLMMIGSISEAERPLARRTIRRHRRSLARVLLVELSRKCDSASQARLL